MMTKDLIKEINQKKNLEGNLPKYLNELATITKDSAYFGLTFHYYTFEEMVLENDYSKVTGFNEVYQAVNEAIKECFGATSDVTTMNQFAMKLNEVRNTIIKRMKVLTALTDSFQIYEYILNRLEFKFTDALNVQADEMFSQKIMQYIFADEDNQTMNLKIQEVVGQLPVRMTKQKFLALLNDSLSIYKGSDIASVKSYVYMIRTAAGIDRPEGYEEEFPELIALKAKFVKADFKNADQAEYTELKSVLEQAVAILESTAEAYYTLQEVVNDFLAILLLTPYADMPGTLSTFSKESNSCREIVHGINQSCFVGTEKSISSSITKKLGSLEGKQERLLELRATLQSIFVDVKENNADLLESMMLEKEYNCLEQALILQSNSMFVEFDEEADTNLAHELFMKRTSKELTNEFIDLFAASSQVVSRAIMANVLSKMPVFFNNRDEVMSYITNSLEACSDTSEKMACIKLLQEIIG